MAAEVQAVVSEVAGAVPGARWSVCVRDAAGSVIAAHAPDDVLPTASVGKILLLIETARRCEQDPALLDTMLSRRTVDPVGAAGLWQHLRIDDLPLDDVAVLVSAFSDNLATNVLLSVMGLAPVTRLAEDLGLRATRLLDVVRSERGPDTDPPYLSVGSAAELSHLMAGMAGRTLVSPAVSERLENWLATDSDTSMVAGAFGIDPLTHVEPDRGILVRHKTGGDAGTKAETGTLRGRRTAVAYAVIARWDDTAEDLRDPVQRGMLRIGECLRRTVQGS